MTHSVPAFKQAKPIQGSFYQTNKAKFKFNALLFHYENFISKLQMHPWIKLKQDVATRLKTWKKLWKTLKTRKMHACENVSENRMLLIGFSGLQLFNSKKIEYFRRKNLSKPVSYRLIFNVFKQNNLSYSLQKQVTSFPSFTE